MPSLRPRPPTFQPVEPDGVKANLSGEELELLRSLPVQLKRVLEAEDRDPANDRRARVNSNASSSESGVEYKRSSEAASGTGLAERASATVIACTRTYVTTFPFGWPRRA